MKIHRSLGFPALGVIVLSAFLGLSVTPEAGAARRKGNPPPSPTPTPTPSPTPAPTPTPPPQSSPTPAPNTSRATGADTTIDNRFVTMGIQLGDGRNQGGLDVYSNALVHTNARIATAQGFFTASQRGVSGVIQNPLPTATPSVDPATLWRNDAPPKTAVDWGWLGNKKSRKARR